MAKELSRPEVNSFGQKELDKAEKKFDEFQQEIKEVSSGINHRMDLSRRPQEEMQVPLSTSQINNAKDIYLKPKRSIGSREKFNEKYREAYTYDKELVAFIAENKELVGEEIDVWTKPYAGMPAEEWIVPTNKPVWGPRYLAEQIKRKYYNRLVMNERQVTSQDGTGTFTGQLVVEEQRQRLDARPVAKGSRSSVFLGASGF